MWAESLVVFSAIVYSTAAIRDGVSQHHRFIAGNNMVTMRVLFGKPHMGTPLVFYDDRGRPVCFVGNGESGACPDRFVGSVALVTYTIKTADRKLRSKTSIREHVTVTAQSPDLPPRPPFDKTQIVKEGIVTDLQAFGYDEKGIPAKQREAERRRSRQRLWRYCRQELYLNHESVAFAVINWRYTLDAIEIVGVEAR